jgi:hypothetical protein
MCGTWLQMVALGDTWWQMRIRRFGLVLLMILTISGAFGGRLRENFLAFSEGDPAPFWVAGSGGSWKCAATADA